jgi:c-di-GMP-binding flagellar brake protein YcgR
MNLVTPMTAPEQGPAQYQSQLTRVTDPAQIALLLRRIKDSRSLLNITLRGEPRGFLSAILDVKPVEGVVYLDELVPREGHAAVMRARGINVFTQCQGVDISFNCEIQDSGKEDGAVLYRASLPDILYYSQRREYHRVRVAHAHPVALVIRDETGNVANGEVLDISAGGLGAELNKPGTVPFQQGLILPNCMLKLFTDIELTLALEVRFLSRDDKGRPRIGGRFVELTRGDQKIIEQFVASLDREWRRKLAKD